MSSLCSHASAAWLLHAPWILVLGYLWITDTAAVAAPAAPVSAVTEPTSPSVDTPTPPLPAPSPAVTLGSERDPLLANAALRSLFHAFAAQQSVHAQFTESKQIALLAMPLASSGVVHYCAPNRLLRRTVKPQSAALLIDGDTLKMRDANKVTSIDLGAYAAARELATGFLQLLQGRPEPLMRGYELHFTGDMSSWVLLLRPRDEALRALVETLEFSGSGTRVREMKILEHNGDATTTRFGPVTASDACAGRALDELFERP